MIASLWRLHPFRRWQRSVSLGPFLMGPSNRRLTSGAIRHCRSFRKRNIPLRFYSRAPQIGQDAAVSVSISISAMHCGNAGFLKGSAVIHHTSPWKAMLRASDYTESHKGAPIEVYCAKIFVGQFGVCAYDLALHRGRARPDEELAEFVNQAIKKGLSLHLLQDQSINGKKKNWSEDGQGNDGWYVDEGGEAYPGY